MIDGTAKDYRLLANLERARNNQLPKRIVKALPSLETGLTGYKISRLQQALQAAARAKHDGADIEWIVAALLHDISDDLAPDNHGQFAASIIKPYVSRPVTWTVNMHGLFQQTYYARHLGQDPCSSDRYHNHPYFEHRVNFCAEWDQPSFDPHYKTPPLEHFIPVVETILTRQAFDHRIL